MHNAYISLGLTRLLNALVRINKVATVRRVF